MSLGRRAYFPVPMHRLAPMHNTLHPQLDPHDAPHVSFGSRALAVSLAPPRLLSYCVTQPLSASCLCATPASCSPSTSAPRAAPKTAASPHPCMCRYCCTPLLACLHARPHARLCSAATVALRLLCVACLALVPVRPWPHTSTASMPVVRCVPLGLSMLRVSHVRRIPSASSPRNRLHAINDTAHHLVHPSPSAGTMAKSSSCLHLSPHHSPLYATAILRPRAPRLHHSATCA
jgi:hypothetical protein